MRHNPGIHKWQLILVVLVGQVTQEQRDVIAFVQEKNRVLRQHLNKHFNGHRLLLSQDQRQRLAVAAKRVSWDRAINPISA